MTGRVKEFHPDYLLFEPDHMHGYQHLVSWARVYDNRQPRLAFGQPLLELETLPGLDDGQVMTALLAIAIDRDGDEVRV
jgi:hypothetical protein